MTSCYVGIDPGISFTGVAILSEDDEVLFRGVVKTYSRWSLQRRVKAIEVGVSRAVAQAVDRGYTPVIGMVEGFAFWGGKPNAIRQFVRSAVVTGAATASALIGLDGVEAETVSPATWRRVVGVKMSRGTTRDERKAYVLEAVERYLGAQPEGQPDHITDALGLALYARKIYG